MQNHTYAVWSLNRAVRRLIKVALLFPLMAVLFLPAVLYDGLCWMNRKLDDWWWA